MVNQQVTLLSINNGTSETECDITFKFNNYLNQKVMHKKKINKRFLEWFVGFTEGKGSFIVFNNKVYFDISVNIKDIQVVYYIKKELGFGKVIIKKDLDNCCKSVTASFYVTSLCNFYRLITLFNGNLCTVNKKEQFKNWLKFFNNQYSKDILFIDRVLKPSLTTGWLSGYIDALGSFTGRLEKSNQLQARKPYLTFFILQKEFYILNVICYILNISFKYIKYNKYEGVWTLTISSFNKLKLIINYLNRYPLKTNKSLAFAKWYKIYDITLKKEHVNEIGLNKIKSLTKEMNKYF